MMTPPETVDPLDSVNAILAANVREQRLLTESLRQPLIPEKRTKHRYQRTLCYYIYSCFTRQWKNDKNMVNDFLTTKDAKIGIMNITTPRKRNADLQGSVTSEAGRKYSEIDEEAARGDAGNMLCNYCFYVNMSLCLSLLLYLALSLCHYLLISLSVSLSLSPYLSLCHYLLICLFVFLFFCVSVSLSFCLPIFLSFALLSALTL